MLKKKELIEINNFLKHFKIFKTLYKIKIQIRKQKKEKNIKKIFLKNKILKNKICQIRILQIQYLRFTQLKSK